MQGNNFAPDRVINFMNNSVGDGFPCFITYEAGPTHNGVDSAKRLVSLAADAGADAIKFQIFDPDRLVADKNLMYSYDVLVDRETGATKTIEEPLYEILKRRSLESSQWEEIKRHSDSLGLAFFATICFEEDLNLLVALGCDSVKIASADVNHYPLIRKAAATGMCVQLDTGNSTIGEIEKAVDLILAEDNERIIIHQCPSGYPAHLTSINLRIIQTLRQSFSFPIAYSDHTPGADMDIAALALGANLLEKTITIDRTQPSVEHLFSLEPDEMSKFVQRIRDVETAFGAARRTFYPEEIKKRNLVRRSVYLLEPVSSGLELKEATIEFRRPGDGLSPADYEILKNFRFTRDLPAGTKVKPSDFQ